MIRLDKYVSEAFSLSRRDAKRVIREGRVTREGVVCNNGAQQIDKAEQILMDGKAGCYQPLVYIIMNKPAGILSASRDARAKTAVDLLPPQMRRKDLFVAGRLDKDTTGMLLLTNDGPFAHNILAPRRHIPKQYFVTLDRAVDASLVAEFSNGVVLGDGTQCKPATLWLETPSNYCRLQITEGKFHQVKRMFATFGYTVTALHREKMGALALDESLLPGEARYLTEQEVASLSSREK